MINSKKKGARGERLWRDVLRAAGFTAHRGQQFSGGSESPDVVCEEMQEGFHPEVKVAERLNVREAYDQAVRDSSDNQIPYVAWKKNRKPWLAILGADDFLKIANVYLKSNV